MNNFLRAMLVLMFVLLLTGCNLNLQPAAQQTTAGAASPTATVTAPAATAGDVTETQSFTGSPPGEPPAGTASWLTDTATPNKTANDYAVGGDEFSRNLFERPFDLNLAYRPDLDLQSANLTFDTQWFYANLVLAGTNPAQGTLSACYGVELDVNLDGRGEFVVWAKPPFTTSWTRQDVVVYGTTTNMVGGSRPLLPDAPWTGATYNQTLFDASQGSIVNAAWVRISPSDPKIIQIAFSHDIIGNPLRFLWGGWADDGIKDPTKFDYNDDFTKTQAGSPYKWDSDYPPKSIFAVDNTCRAPYGFTPNGEEPGGCTLIVPTQQQQVTSKPVYTPTKTLIPGPD